MSRTSVLAPMRGPALFGLLCTILFGSTARGDETRLSISGYDPVAYFTRIDQAMSGGGVLVTNISDRHDEFMHVSPKLGPLRQAVESRGYEEILPSFIYQKADGQRR